jgi:putative transposase
MPRSFLTDVMWDKLVPLLPPEKGETGRPYNAHRPWLEAILWKHRTGAPWRDLPEEFGSWRSIYSRFNRWSKVGLWQAALEVLRQDADTEWLMIDSTVIRAHQHASGAEKGGSKTRPSAGPEGAYPPKCT